MQFDFDKETISNNFIDIEDLGNFVLEATSVNEEVYYLAVKSVSGMSHIFKYGPIIPDIEVLPAEVHCSYNMMDYNQKKIISIINQFLNMPKAEIKDARLIEFNELLENCRNIAEYMEGL